MSESAEEKPAAAPPEKGKSTAILIMAVLAAVTVGGAGGIFVMFKRMPPPQAPAAGAAAAEGGGAAASKEAGGEKEAEAEGEKGKEGKEAVKAGVITMQPFVVNLMDETGEAHFLKVTLAVDLSAKGVEGFERKTPKVRNALLMVLSNLKTTEVMGAPNKRLLMEKLRKEVLDIVGKDSMHELYFTEFVVQ